MINCVLLIFLYHISSAIHDFFSLSPVESHLLGHRWEFFLSFDEYRLFNFIQRRNISADSEEPRPSARRITLYFLLRDFLSPNFLFLCHHSTFTRLNFHLLSFACHKKKRNPEISAATRPHLASSAIIVLITSNSAAIDEKNIRVFALSHLEVFRVKYIEQLSEFSENFMQNT